jgi:hypothetical protein
MTTESPAPKRQQRSWLLIGLGVVAVALFFSLMWSDGAGVSPSPSSRQPRTGKASSDQAAAIDPRELNVRLDALEAPRPDRGDLGRNPFRFRPKPPAAPPTSGPQTFERPAPALPPPPSPTSVPPFPLKLMGFVDLPGGGKLAALSDCKGATFNGAEGKTVDGQYRIVKIGIESVTIEYLNGKGRQTLKVEGCPPR